MSARKFFDTTILIYAISDQKGHAKAALDLLSSGGYVSVQVLNEFASVARRKLGMEWHEIRSALDAVRTLCEPPLAISAKLHDAALEIAERYGYHIYDALIVASALEAKCDTLCSEDMQHGQKIGSLTIRNPFRKG